MSSFLVVSAAKAGDDADADAGANTNTAASTIDSDFEYLDDDCQQIFPQRLMNILSNEKNHDAICWLPHGRAFIIRNRKIFAEKIMPRFFSRKSKYSSFTRKLNRWNFIRVSSGPELGAYYHEFFLREKPHLAAQMFCKNARTMIAMASDSPKPAPLQKAQIVPSQPFQQQQQAQAMPCLSAKQADAATNLYLQNQQLDPAVQFLLNQQLSVNLCQPKPMQQPQQQPQQQMQMQQIPMVPPASMQQPPAQVFSQFSLFQPQQQQIQQQQSQPKPQLQFTFQENPSPLEPNPILAYGDGTQILPPTMTMNDSLNAAADLLNSSGVNNNISNVQNMSVNSTMNMNNNESCDNNLNLWQQIQAQKQQQEQMMQLRQLMALKLQRQQTRKSSAKNFRASAA